MSSQKLPAIESTESEEAVTATEPPPAPAWDEYVRDLHTKWSDLLETDPPELDVQRFLERHPCLLPGATDNSGPGGHHGVCWSSVIRQPELPGLDARLPDFMWVRRDTAAIRPILIEIEAPAKPWFIGTGAPNAKLTQALDQLLEWKVWFADPGNQQLFRRAYVPPEYTHRSLEPQYVLVYGRDREFRAEASPHPRPDLLRRKRDLLPRKRRASFHLRPAPWQSGRRGLRHHRGRATECLPARIRPTDILDRRVELSARGPYRGHR